MKKLAIIAMSGGVDSSVSASLLQKDDYEVVGLTLSMGRPCDENTIQDAKKVADKLGIRHYVRDVSANFSAKVVDYFVNSYANGETPNPCAKCNRELKFKELMSFREEVGADLVATGHYARILQQNQEYELHRGANKIKDQSYFLAHLPKDYLSFIKFPLGVITSKDEVRQIAAELQLPVATKKDSQDLCFSNGNYRDILFSSLKNIEGGRIRHINGEILGEHKGLLNYTIGQRKGLNISYREPLYVIYLDTKNNEVVVGEEEYLFSNKLSLRDVNLLANLEKDREYTFQLRSTHSGQKGKITISENTATIELAENSRAITRGQLCVVYDDTRVMSSGYIL